MNRFQDQVAVITGASSGIGRAIALGLAQEGASLALIARNAERLHEVADAARTGSPQVCCLPCDLGQDNDLRSLVSTLKNELPEVHLLVHSAGTFHLGAIRTQPVEYLDELYRINLRAPYVLTQALLPALQSCQGQVVFINSSAGAAKSRANNGPYSATKHALRALADSLRDEVNPDGIRVISLFPGRTATPMQAHIYQLEGRPYQPELLVQPEDVASLLLQALALPRTVEVTDLHFRPLIKSY